MKTQDQHKRLESFVEKWKQSQDKRNSQSSIDNTHRYGSTSTCGFILEYQGKRYCSQENWINICEDSGIQYKKIPVGYYLECHRK